MFGVMLFLMNSITIYNEVDLGDKKVLIPLLGVLLPYVTFIVLTIIEPVKPLSEKEEFENEYEQIVI